MNRRPLFLVAGVLIAGAFTPICAQQALPAVDTLVAARIGKNDALLLGNPAMASVILGDPDAAMRDLRHIYTLLQKYRVNNEGRAPATITALAQEIIRRPRDYGYANYAESRRDFINPDSFYTGIPDPGNSVAYSITIRRPDGSALDAPKTDDERDVWALTDVYYRSWGAAGRDNPVGFYLVLWDDGEVEKIPYDLTFSVVDERAPRPGFAAPSPPRLRSPFFAGQAGLAADALSYDDRFLNWPASAVSPRGRFAEDANSRDKPQILGQQETIADNGGPEALVAFSRLLRFPDRNGIERLQLWHQFDPAQPEFTLGELQEGATALGLSCALRPLSLPELRASGSPALLYDRDDGRMVALSAIGQSHALLVDGSGPRIIALSDLRQSYQGEALVPTSNLSQRASIVAEDAVRQIALPDGGAEVSQRVVLRNRGERPVKLSLNSPLPGVSRASLSARILRPGEVATLDLTLKWRPFLRTNAQNVLVSLNTDDPLAPQLNLGFRLTRENNTV